MRFFSLFALLSASVFAQAPTIGSCPVLPADNIWNTPVDTLPLHANSATYINTIGAGRTVHADFGSGTWNGGPIGIPFIRVNGSQQKYAASFLYYDESDPGPYAIPLNAPIEGGSASTGDRHAIAVDTDNCILYELYRAFPQSSTWRADSGAIYDLRSHALRPASWTSADAAGLPIMPGLVRYDEVAAGEIHHAIRFTVPQTQRAYIWPARHYASSLTDLRYPPMGLRVRLKASFDISSYPANVQVILRAMKKYGMMLADNGSAWYISGQPDERWNNSNLHRLHAITGADFEVVDTSSLMIDPNSGQARQTGTAVSVSPSSAVVVTQENRQFTATVTGSTNQSVTWSVNGVEGGNSQVGYIDAAGRYSAPSVVPNPATVTVRAASVATPSAIGTASVTIRYPAPAISSVTPNPAQAGNVTLTVTGTGFHNGGSVRLNGSALTTTFVSSTRLTAIGSASAASSVPVTVTNPDGQVSNSYTIAVNGATAPVTVTVSPSGATVRLRRTRQFTAAVANTSDKRVVWRVNGVTGGNSTVGTISSAGLYTAPGALPSPSQVTVTAVSVADSRATGSGLVFLRR